MKGFTRFTRFTGFTGFAGFATLVSVGIATVCGGRLQPDLHAAQSDPAPTYSKDVAPILFARCSVCHHPGGAAPFSVLSYAEARAKATLIAQATRTRLMPPWKVDPDDNAFVGMEPLTSDQIDVLQRWAAAGAPEGDPRLLPTVPQWTADWQLGTPDLIVSAREAYTVPAGGTDSFRILVFRLPVDRRRYVRGIEFHPGGGNVVHHATIRVDPTPTSRQLDEEDPAPGYDGLLAHSAVYPNGHFLAWTPGQVPPLLPKGLAWTLDPGTDLVVQLHLQPTGKAEEVRPSIGLFFGDDPPTRIPTMVRLGRQSIDIPAGESAFTVTDSYVIPVDVEVQAVQPHAHFRAREIRGTATLPDGTTKSLVHIANWDFRWQHVFRYVTPIALPKGTKLEMRYVYDNSTANPNNTVPPVRVLWGQQSSDEMGDLWIQVLTASEQDRARLNADYQPKMLAEDIVGIEMRIRAEPGRIALHDDAALMYLANREPQKAVTAFRASMVLKPDAAATHYNLGYALTVAAGSAAGGAGQIMLTEAVSEYEEALRRKPDYAAAHNNLGNVLLQRGRNEEALTHLSEAVRLDPRSAESLYGLGRAQRALKNRAGAIDSFRRALTLYTNWAPVMSDLAFLLAASPEDALRDGAEALRLAQRVNALTGGRDAAALDVLAAAYAETGQFDSAVLMAETAVELAPPGRAAAIISERLALYRQRKPYRIQ